MKLYSLLALCLSVLVPCSAEAAYRVYKLRLHYYNWNGQAKKKTRVVLSTLDPYQYEHYHGGYRWMRVEGIDSWYCPGDTSGFRPYCRKKVPKKRAPSSLNKDPKRVSLPYNRQPVIP